MYYRVFYSDGDYNYTTNRLEQAKESCSLSNCYYTEISELEEYTDMWVYINGVLTQSFTA